MSTYKVEGALTFDTVAHLRHEGNAFINKNEMPVFDLSQVTNNDSSALALLLAWLRCACDKQRVIRFIHFPKKLVEVIQAYELTDVIKEDEPLYG